MLATTTRVPTPYGWTTIGDLAPGSVVFDEVGYPVFVRRITNPISDKVYRVGLTNKSLERGAIYITEKQELCTWNRDRMRQFTYETGITSVPRDWAEHDGETRPISDIKDRLANYEKHGTHLRHSIPMTFPLVLPHYVYQVPPYIMGLVMNLHDRHTGLMKCTESMWDWYEKEFTAAGFPLVRTKKRLKRPKPDAPVTFSSGPLNRLLNQEHAYINRGLIPNHFLRGSTPQRMDLLAGLLDYNFFSENNNVRSVHVWCGGNQTRFEQTLELVRSLGYSAVPHHHRVSDSYIVKWTPLENPYRYPKFRARLPDFNYLKRNTFTKFCWRVQSVELDSETQVRAVEVTSPSGLFTVSDLFLPVVGGRV